MLTIDDECALRMLQYHRPQVERNLQILTRRLRSKAVIDKGCPLGLGLCQEGRVKAAEILTALFHLATEADAADFARVKEYR